MLHEFENLPTLTTRQANAIAAYFGSVGSLYEASTETSMPFAEFLDCLASPAAQAHLRSARRLAEDRARAQLADAAVIAAKVLQTIAEDVELDKTERRRAATTLVRAFRAEPRPKKRIDVSRLADIIKTLEATDDDEPAHRESPRAAVAPHTHNPPAAPAHNPEPAESKPQHIPRPAANPEQLTPERPPCGDLESQPPPSPARPPP